MKNFVLNNPTKILFGKRTIPAIGKEIITYGKRVLFVYGEQSIKRNNIFETVSDSLLSQGCILTPFGGVTPNPTVEIVQNGIDLCKDEECDVICAVGGGSVIDTAKAISCGTLANHDVWKFFTAKKSPKAALPLLCVATLAGSGSENNSGMVITNSSKQLKFGYGNRLLFPKVSILDPETTYSVSAHQTAYGAVDTVVHLIEFYCNHSADSVSTQLYMIEILIKSVMENCLHTISDPGNYNSRAHLMWASALALSGIPSAGLGRIGFPVHLIEHSISAHFNTPHGAGLAVVLPGWMSHHAAVEPTKIARLGKTLFNIRHTNTSVAACETAARFKRWFHEIGCPVNISDLGIKTTDLSVLAGNCQPLAKLWRLREYSEEQVVSILRLCSN